MSKAGKESNLSLVITDRLNETRKLEVKLESDKNKDKKAYNKELIDRLKKFQHDANDLMTEFVVKEKQALNDKKISNDHLKVLLNKPSKVETESEDEESGSGSDKSENENKTDSPRLKRPSNEEVQQELVEKKNCLEENNVQ